MKTKLYAKKTLSVFLAIMMLMSAWVFVAPEKASAAAASEIEAANRNAVNAIINTFDDVNFTTVYGHFIGDSGVEGSYTDSERDTVYKNIIYSPTVGQNTNESPCALRWNNVTLTKSGNYIRYYFPNTVMINDGKKIPTTPVVMTLNPTSASYIHGLSGFLDGGTNFYNGISLGYSNWKGFGTNGNEGSAENPQFLYSFFRGGKIAFTINGDRNYDVRWRHDRANSGRCSYYWSNTLTFDDEFGSDEYYRAVKPALNWYGGNNYGEGETTLYYNKTANNEGVNKTIYIIDVEKLNSTIAAAKTRAQEILNNPAKYTTASVNNFVTKANALTAINIDNYINSSTSESAIPNQVSSCANAIKTAVDNYNNSRLEIQKYSLKFVNIDGKEKYNNEDIAYGTTVDCASIASGLGNSIKANGAQYHQLYTWNTNASITVTDNVVINEAVAGQEVHKFDNNGNGTVDSGDYAIGDDKHSLTCSVCSYVREEAHKAGVGYVTVPETCTEDGTMTYDCSACGKKAIKTTIIDEITGHNFVTVCSKDDNSHWKKCSRCDAYGWAGVENAYEAHSWANNPYEAQPSTCAVQGYEMYKCTQCEATKTETLPLAAHTITPTAAKDVTNLCGGDGNEAFWSCSVCNRIWLDEALTNELTDKTDADNDGIPDALETKGPDHNFTGAYASRGDGAEGTHNRKCTRCNTYGLMVDGVAKVGATEKHTFTSTSTDSTCTVAGKTTYTCSLCQSSYKVDLPLAAHVMTKTEAKAATCTEAGNIAYWTCSTCNKVYSDEEGTNVVTNTVIPAKGHSYADGNTDTENPETDRLISAATCQKAAVYQETCDWCKAESPYTYSYGTSDKNAHQFEGEIKANADGTHSYKCTVEGCDEYGGGTGCTYKVVEDVASTCKTAGYTKEECKDCGHTKTTTKELDPNYHTGEGTYVSDALEAKCNTDGYTGNTYCTGCDALLENGEIITADPANHPHENMRGYDGKEATCQEEGYTAYRYCDQCGTYETPKTVIGVKAHVYGAWVSKGDGTHTRTCTTCAEGTQKATETGSCEGGTANCVDKKVCTVCSGAYGEVDSTKHKTVIVKAKVEPTCQTEGTQAYQYCTACNKAIEEIVKIPKLPHAYTAWVSNGNGTHTKTCGVCLIDEQTADCNGGTAYCNALAKCKDCLAEYGIYDPDNHSTTATTLKGVVAATCQTKGYSGDRHYNCCDVVSSYGAETDKLAHTFDIEVEGSRVPATCIAEGSVTYKCSTCVEGEGLTVATETRTLDIDPNNHATPDNTVVVNQKDATCEEDGHTGDVYYSCCYDEEKTAEQNKKALKEKGTTIKANGQHVYGPSIPEYMIDSIDEETDADGNVISRTINVKAEEPDYAEKIAARRADNKWYHAQQCKICNVVTYTACYTYAHTYNCVDTDICVVCDGLCSLIDADKHKDDLVKVTDGAVAATCISDGRKSYYECADCDKTYFDEAGKYPLNLEDADDLAQLIISKETVSHTWDAGVETEGTCGTSGKIVYTCTIDGCGAVKEVNTGTSSQNHTWKTEYEVTKEPTCHSVGYKVIKCSVCGAVKPNSVITLAATGDHDYDANGDDIVDRNDAVVTPGESCQKPGTLTYTCQNEGCTNTMTEVDTEGVSAHNFGEWVTVGGDCSTGIVQERTCMNCGEKERQTLTTNTHVLVVYVKVEPTPEKNGYVIYECENCKLKTEPQVLEYEGPAVTEKHIIDETEYRTVKEASCTKAEQREYTCIRCGEKIVMFVGELAPHYWLEQPAEVSTCEKAGHSAYYRCVVCREERDRVNYEPLGHADNDGDGKCDECNSAFYEDGSKTCGCLCHKEGWFMQLIYKIVNFFWKLFKINPSCSCGATHY